MEDEASDYTLRFYSENAVNSLSIEDIRLLVTSMIREDNVKSIFPYGVNSFLVQINNYNEAWKCQKDLNGRVVKNNLINVEFSSSLASNFPDQQIDSRKYQKYSSSPISASIESRPSSRFSSFSTQRSSISSNASRSNSYMAIDNYVLKQGFNYGANYDMMWYGSPVMPSQIMHMPVGMIPAPMSSGYSAPSYDGGNFYNYDHFNPSNKYNQIFDLDPLNVSQDDSIDKRRLFFGNLPYTTTLKDLKNEIQKYGFSKFEIEMPSQSLNKGYAVVTFETSQAASQVVSALHNSKFQGRRLTVRIDRFPGLAVKNKRNTENFMYFSSLGEVDEEESEVGKKKSGKKELNVDEKSERQQTNATDQEEEDAKARDLANQLSSLQIGS